MNQLPDDEFPVAELASLPRDVPPPADLESRVVDAMYARSLLNRPSRSPWLHAAAAVVLLAAGIAIGRSTTTGVDESPVVTPNRFMLMLIGADPTGDDRARAERYRQWSVEQRSTGRQVSGDRLANRGIAVVRNGSSAVMEPEVQGFFVISAADIDEAAAIARSSPHVQAGGLIIVRPIDTP
jgi:hypothetical protein